jgi:hypothetical protein
MDGNDQGGRGPVQDIDLAATIAAYERFIAEWKRNLHEKRPALRPDRPYRPYHTFALVLAQEGGV